MVVFWKFSVMNDHYYPWDTRLDHSSTVRSLKSPCCRMFISITTMRSVTTDSKVCNMCRLQFNNWIMKNSEFETIVAGLDSDLIDDDDNDTRYSLLVSMNIIKWLFSDLSSITCIFSYPFVNRVSAFMKQITNITLIYVICHQNSKVLLSLC